MSPIKNVDTDTPCTSCKGKCELATGLWRYGKPIKKECGRCSGTGVEPHPQADVDRGPVKP